MTFFFVQVFDIYLKFAVSDETSPGSTVRVCAVSPSLQPVKIPPSTGCAVNVTGKPSKNETFIEGESSRNP